MFCRLHMFLLSHVVAFVFGHLGLRLFTPQGTATPHFFHFERVHGIAHAVFVGSRFSGFHVEGCLRKFRQCGFFLFWFRIVTSAMSPEQTGCAGNKQGYQ